MTNNEVFILGDDKFLINGINEVLRTNFAGRKYRFTIRQVTLLELMKADVNYKKRKKYSIALVPAHIYETLYIFTGMENIRLVPGNIKVDDISSLIGEISIADAAQLPENGDRSLCLTARERRYCYLLYRGISNKKIARYFQCTEKNISYLKRKIMSKWQCKNSLDFYKTINYFYNHTDSGDARGGTL